MNPYRLFQGVFKRKEHPETSVSKKQHLLITRNEPLCMQKGAGNGQGWLMSQGINVKHFE